MHALLTPVDNARTGLFWSASQPVENDFSAEDPLALDYLGQQVGLWLFPGFTTRTNRAQYYAVVLYGLHLVQRAIETYRLAGDDEERTLLFERWERCWALATMESRNGLLNRGDADAMRGIRGARRAWFAGVGPLPLDFDLISRQSELGGLGAYLNSLRHHQLVGQGSLRISPLAQEIVSSFWSEKHSRQTVSAFEEYVLVGMNPKATSWSRTSKDGGVTLKRIGDKAKLTSITDQNRSAQRERLWTVLFTLARDRGTLQLANCIIAAQAEGIEDSEQLLAGVAHGRWGPVDTQVRELAKLGVAFGRVSRILLACFNRAYRFVEEGGWNSDFAEVATTAFPREEAEKLSTVVRSLAKCGQAPRIAGLSVHGEEFMALVQSVVGGNAIEKLNALLRYHAQVQLTRRGAAPWLKQERTRLTMQLPGYTGYLSSATFPSLKLNTVRQILRDLGRFS